MGEDGGLIPCFCQKYLGRAHVTRLTEGSHKKGAHCHFPQTSLFSPQQQRDRFLFMLQGIFFNWDPTKKLDCKLCQKVSVSEFAYLQLHKTLSFRSILKRKFSSGTKGEDCVG